MNHVAMNPLDAAMERIHAAAAQGGAVSRTQLVAEIIGLTGTYFAKCEGAKGQHEREYKVEFGQIQRMRARRDELLRNPSILAANPDELPALIKHIDSYEAYLKTLTEVKWEDKAPNVVTTVGANALLDSGLAGSSYTAATYMGLIGAVSYSGVPVIADTMASHGTWTEAGTTNAPTYTSPRKTISWSAAASKSKSPSSAPVFAITGTGTAKGVFLVFGSGAVSTIDSTAGILYSAGLFTGGDQAVVNTNTLTVTYAATA
jgi:hypothetical protein